MKDNNIKSKKDDDSKKSNKEIIEVKSMEEFIELVNRPIVIENNTLGTLELRPIFDDDLNYLLKNINEGLDGESLCKGFIINQLNSPEISIESLNDLNQSEIKSILERYLKCNNMDEFFNLSNDDVYNDFKDGVIAYREHIVKPFEDNYGKMVDSIRNSLSSLNIYSGLEDYILNTQITSMQLMANNLGVSQAVQNLKHMADITSPIDDALNNSAVSQAVSAADSARRMAGSVVESNMAAVSQAVSAADSARRMAGSVVESNMAAVSQALTGVDAMSQTMINLNHVFNNSAIFQASEILKAIQPQIDFWNDWINSNEYIIKFFEDYNEFWKNVQERYNISKKRALNCIKKYHWFISPSMDPSIVYDLVSICESNSKSKWGAINHVFNDYFLGNDCENLDLFVDNWSSNPIFDGRMKIIRDCVKIMKNCPKDVNFSNLVVPVLIAQIDGIQMEFMNQKGLKVDRNIVCDLDGNRKKDEHGQNIKFDRYIRDLTSGDEYLDAMSDVFLDVLFQHTMPGEGYQTSIKFSRHKIMHGENFHYGRTYNAMRCFMILDFLHGLSFEKY
ncbi:hypothetical protein [Methanobrevibacter thaueri]|uniref:Uncharacterized protein n=1 Tax=Methanobrevibacter thaueri TaxID=190975 RepID=A0A315XLJ6_9EURY|nr:hypothetical protein [Methanobrevibacter thaueri]PWB85396.1 hypothetical protein MBBTH_19960 [Methanobrevibacter thaueri]